MNEYQNDNTSANYDYDAFISYRHLQKDKKVAVRLQQLLERRRWKKGQRLRIFRDQSELPSSSDLGADIRKALERSRYLIVICSSAYSESKWCMEELNYFRKLHGETNLRILAVLVEGEPQESFPEQLMWENRQGTAEDGTAINMKVEIEPLGADVRAKNDYQMLRLLKREYLRIVAPILGCGFDELYRRSQRRTRRTILLAAGAVTTVAVAFGCYSSYMLDRIFQKQQELYANESLRLASFSEQQCDSGDYRLSMLLAQAALPKQIDEPERPLLSEAETALRNAVTQQLVSENYQAVQVQARINFNVSSWVICDSYDEGRKLAVSDFENTYLYDVATGKLLFSCQGCEVYFNEDATRAARIDYRLVSGGTYDAFIELYTTEDGNRYFSGQYFRDKEPAVGLWDEDTDCCYLLYEALYANIPSSLDDYEGYSSPELVLLDVVDSEGNILKGKTLTPKLEERYENNYLYSYFESYYYYNSTQDADYNSDGEFSERADGKEDLIIYIADILENAGYRVNCANITDGGELLMFSVYSSNGFMIDGKENNLAWIFVSFKLLEEDQLWTQIIPGECYLDRSSGLIYNQCGSQLDILTYEPDNFKNQGIADIVQAISEDGKLCLTRTSEKLEDWNYRVKLRVWECDALKEPLVDEWIAAETGFDLYMYYTTPDMDRVFLQTEEEEFQLWEPGKGCILTFSADGEASSLSVSADGKLLAIAYGKESDAESWVEIRSAQDASLLQKYILPEGMYRIMHLEFEGEQLLVSTEEQSIIFDVNGAREPIEIPDGNIGYNRDYYLTEDGLLFCAMRTNKLYELSAVYDIKTGEQVFGDAMYFQYNEKNKTLVYQVTNNVSDYSTSVHVARLNRDNLFEDIYTVVPRKINMVLGEGRQCMDENYFLLNGEDGCEVYEAATGNKVLSLQEGVYLLVNGMVYDSRFNSIDKLLYYPIMKLPELQAMAEQYLSSEQGIRELTMQEKELYFISE